MDTITVRAVITKNQRRGWSCQSYVKYPDWPQEIVTSNGRETLASTLWHLVMDYMDLGATLTVIQVKGKPMPRAEIWERIHKTLTGSGLSYRLPAVREYLLSQEVANGRL